MIAGHEGAGSQTVALAGRMVEYCKINHTFLFSHRSNLSHKKRILVTFVSEDVLRLLFG